MKLKIALLTSTVLSIILFVLGGFLYVTVFQRALSLQYSDLGNTTQAIADYYSGRSGDETTADDDLVRGLSQFKRRDQKIFILGRTGNVIASVGDLAVPNAITHFQPTDRLVQRTMNVGTGDIVIYTSLPIRGEDGQTITGYAVLLSARTDVTEYMKTLLTLLIIGSLGAVVLAGVGGYWIAWATLRPMHQLIRVVQRIEATRLDERVPTPRSRDEVARLTHTFNNMLSRIERSFDQQRQFVADASHEIRTPLTTILGYANLLQRWGKSDPEILDRAIVSIQKESLRLRNLADDLLILAGLEASRDELREPVDVDAIVADVVEQLSILNTDVVLVQQLDAGVEARISSEHFRQVVTNVLSNALKYTASGGTVTVTTRVEGDRVLLTVEDTGCGIAQEDLPHVFERFYRADKSRERKQGGNGLGLAIVHELVHFYGGTIRIESEINRGTRVHVELPMEHPS